MRIAQILPNLHRGDAIGNFTFFLDEVLRQEGHQTAIIANTLQPALKEQGVQVLSADPNAWDLVIYHYSIHSEPIEVFYRSTPAKRAILYHNITPATFFSTYDAVFADLLKVGREKLRALSLLTDIAWADSTFNADELRAFGFKNPKVLGIPVNPETLLGIESDAHLEECLNDGLVNILFCGRLAPNKRQEDLIRLLAWYKKYIRNEARLLLVGSALNAYEEDLVAMAKDLGISESVIFTGHVSESEHAAYFKCADVFVSMSEHEGFCVPLLEAMAHRVPVMAFDAGAIRETMGASGIVFRDKDIPLLAELVEVLVTQKRLRSRILSMQSARLADFSPSAIADRAQRLLREAFVEVGAPASRHPEVQLS